MTKEIQVVDTTTDEVVQRVDVSLRDDDEVRKAREALTAQLEAGQEVRLVD